MYSTQAYLYQQRTQVLMLDTSGQYFTMRYNSVYSKKLTINLGVDNVLLFSLVNQDEKPVNVVGCNFIFRLISQAGYDILYEAPMAILSPTTGQIRVTIPAADLLTIPPQPASYSITVARGNLTQAVYTNAQSGARALVDIVAGALPVFIPSTSLTIPTTEMSAQYSYGGTNYENYPTWSNQFWNGNADGAWYYNNWNNTEYYSSFIEPTSSLTTIQMDLVGYTGTIKAQWAETYQSLWYNITESTTYYNETRTISMNVLGWYPLLRLCFNNSIFATPEVPGIPALAYAICENGVVTQIVVSNGGSGYLAPPQVDILGDGAGAVAQAEINEDGVVTAINVVNGGSGYWPIPTGGINTAAYPVPPQNQGAYVAITTGTVTNLFYR